MIIDLISLFPEYFSSPLQQSILRRAQELKKVEIFTHDLRAYGIGPRRQVDDLPYGGGGGMVLKPEPLAQAVKKVKKAESKVILLSPQGSCLNDAMCQQLSLLPHLILICGHYEGVDERFIQRYVDQEISIGDYIVTNGCVASLVLMDAVVRLLPGVLGNAQGADIESFREKHFDFPQFTRPEEFEGKKVPEVLLSGDHARVNRWRHTQALNKTMHTRDDLFSEYVKQESGQVAIEGIVRIALRVNNLHETASMYRKVFRELVVQQDRLILRVGGCELHFFEGIDSFNPFITLEVEESYLIEIMGRMRQYPQWFKECKIESLVLSCEDMNGYRWRIQRRSCEKGCSTTKN